MKYANGLELVNGEGTTVDGAIVLVLTHKERRHRRKAIARSIREGENVREVCDRFGVSIGTVREACKEHCILFTENSNNPYRGASLQFPTYRMIGELITTSDPLTVIAAKYGVTKQWVSLVYGRCKEAGIPVQERRCGRSVKAGSKTNRIDKIDKTGGNLEK